MYFEQFYLACLSHASYMLGSGGVAAVVDPQRDIGIYLDAARRRELRIGYVVETHLHTDFVSGHRELAELTGATIYVGARAGARFRHVPVRDGDVLSFGNCRLEFLETPGHTIDSISVLVADLQRSAVPFAVLTGDTLFAGDMSRPDLSAGHSPRQLAAMLYGSLRQLLRLPESVEVWPAHGPGAELRSTIARERAAGSACMALSRDDFVALVTADIREAPAYFAADAEINRRGAAPLWALPPPESLDPLEVLMRQEAGHIVLDTRPPVEFEAAHIPGALHIGLAGQYAFWAGTLLGVYAELVLVVESPARLAECRTRLARVGIERVTGCLRGGVDSWAAKGLPVARVERIHARDLAARFARFQVVDVRRPGEWSEGRIAGALPHPLERLPESVRGLDPARPAAAICRDGYRSAIASSLLLARGFSDVCDVIGGLDAWQAQGLPVARGSP